MDRRSFIFAVCKSVAMAAQVRPPPANPITKRSSGNCLRPDGAALNDVGIDFDTPINQKAFESGPSGDRVAGRLGGLKFPDRRGSSVSHSSNRLATMAADFSWRAFTRVAGSLPRMSSSTFQSAVMVVIVCVARCELLFTCSS